MNPSQFHTRFADVIGFVCKRPEMYTMNGTFPEVIAFIEGYTSADSVKKARIEWHDFNKWLSSKRDYSDTKVAAEYLREQYPSDDEAINQLAYWYAEYARTHDENR